jgi:hypothetical protein
MSLLTNSVTSPDEWDLDPRSIPDCEIWFDAADTRTITGTSPVTAWANKGSFAISATNDVGTCVSGAGTINGRNFISIPKGTNLQFTCAFPVQDRSIFMVFRMQDQLTTQFFAPIFRGTASTSQFLVLLSRASSTSYAYNIAIGNGLGTRINAQSSYATAPATFSQLANPVPNFFGAPAVYGIVHSSAATSLNCISVNGAEYRGGTVPTTLTTSLVASGYDTANLKYVINNSDTSATYNTGMDCCEILYYSRALGDSERKAIEGYLGWKWGVVKRDIAVSPLSVPNCVAWFDADVDYSDAASRATSFTFSSGDNIQTWIDKSGNGNTATAANANRATLIQNASGGNGRCCASFTQAVTVSLISGLVLPPTQSFTLFAVAGSATFLTRRAVCTVNSYPGTTGGYVSLQQNTSNPGVWTWSGGTGFEGFTTGVPLGTLRTDILSAVWSPGSCQYTANGLRQPISTATPTALTSGGQFVISGVNSGTTYSNSWAGQIFEIIVYTGVLSEDNRLLIERYLALKWNVSNYLGSMVRYHPARFWRSFNRYINPLEQTTCTCWLDAADASAVTLVDGVVSQWIDKSGLNNPATMSTAGSRPSYANNLITFASDKYLNLSPFALNNSTGPYAMFWVFNPISSTNWIMAKQVTGVDSLNILSMTNNSGAGGALQVGITGRLYFRAANARTQFVSSSSLATSTLQICALVCNPSGTMSLFVNGTLVNATAGTWTVTNNTTPTSCALGAWVGDSGLINPGVTNFLLGEMLFYNSTTTIPYSGYYGFGTGFRQRIEGYLAWKWGLQASLPSTHPFFPSRLNPDSYVTHPTQTQNSSTFDVMLWLDASDPYGTGVLPPSGTPLAQWVDKSGNGKTAFQITTSRRPTFTYDNGFPAVSFDAASSQRMEANGALLAGAAYNSYCIFVVYRMPTAAANNTIFFLPRTAPSATEPNSIYTVFRTSNNTSTKEFFARYNTTTTKTQTSSPQTGESLNSLADSGQANTGVIMYFNGVDTGVGPTLTGATGLSANDNSSSRYVIGAQVFLSTFANFATAFVKEILVFRRQMATPERQRIEGYLAWKWGMNTSLPTTHAYYKSKP